MLQPIKSFFNKSFFSKGDIVPNSDAEYTRLELVRLSNQHSVMQNHIRALQREISTVIATVVKVDPPVVKQKVADVLTVKDYLTEKGVTGDDAPTFGIGRRCSHIEKIAGRKLVQKHDAGDVRRTLYRRSTLNKAWREHLWANGQKAD